MDDTVRVELEAARAENAMLLQQITRLCLFVEQSTGEDPIAVMNGQVTAAPRQPMEVNSNPAGWLSGILGRAGLGRQPAQPAVRRHMAQPSAMPTAAAAGNGGSCLGEDHQSSSSGDTSAKSTAQQGSQKATTARAQAAPEAEFLEKIAGGLFGCSGFLCLTDNRKNQQQSNRRSPFLASRFGADFWEDDEREANSSLRYLGDEKKADARLAAAGICVPSRTAAARSLKLSDGEKRKTADTADPPTPISLPRWFGPPSHSPTTPPASQARPRRRSVGEPSTPW